MHSRFLFVGFLTAVLFFALFFMSSGCGEECDCDDDDDAPAEDDDSDDEGWFDPDGSAYDNCRAFYRTYYECYDMDVDDLFIDQACKTFEDWEDLNEDDQCMENALEDWFECLSEIDCESAEDASAFTDAITECGTNLFDDIADCAAQADDDDDDDTADDDDDDDVADDDDITDDDDASPDPAPPVISSASWSPTTATYVAADDHWIASILFSVCDVNNNLLGGAIYAYYTGTQTLLWALPVYWDDFTSLPDVSDCAVPIQIKLGTIFGTGTTPPGMGLVCVDLQVTDSQSNWSNLIQNFCVTVP